MLTFFKSKNVVWVPGIRLKRTRWHSCQQWGWSAIRSGNRLEEFSDYWVLYVCYKNFGFCLHYTPKKRYSLTYKSTN